LWAGVRGNDALLHLQKKVETALQRIGLEPETRKFSPHVTLARLRAAPREKVMAFLSHYGLFASGPFKIERFVLFSSHQGSGGSVYHPERVYALTA
jgi:2'-5' RNA ligase